MKKRLSLCSINVLMMSTTVLLGYFLMIFCPLFIIIIFYFFGQIWATGTVYVYKNKI